MKKALFIILLTIMTVALAAGMTCSADQTELNGERISTEEAYLKFSGDEIGDLAELREILHRFDNLKYCDLGTYCVDVTEEKELLDEFTGVEFKFDSVADMYGDKFYSDVEELDLSAVEIDSTETLSEMLPYFKHVKTVTLGENAVPVEEKAALEEKYPDLDFKIVAIYDLLGMKVREDAESVDLGGVAPDYAVLSEKLSLFPSLKYVDLKKHEVPTDTQLSLHEKYPGIEFDWAVDIAGTKVSSLEENVDISTKYMPGHVEELKKVLPLLQRAKKIIMCDCYLSNEEMAKLRDECPDVKIVWRVYMGQRWSLRTDQVAFSVLIYTYNYRFMVTEDIQVLKYCTDLQALDLGHQTISDISVIGDYLTELRLLILADNNLTDLSPLAKLPHLHYLEFFVNNVTDLTPLASCKQLVDLNISYNHNLSDITPLLNLPKLERLWMESTAVSQADVDLLRATYPNATIINYGQGSIDQGWRVHERYYAMMDMWLNHTDRLAEEFAKYD